MDETVEVRSFVGHMFQQRMPGYTLNYIVLKTEFVLANSLFFQGIHSFCIPLQNFQWRLVGPFLFPCGWWSVVWQKCLPVHWKALPRQHELWHLFERSLKHLLTYPQHAWMLQQIHQCLPNANERRPAPQFWSNPEISSPSSYVSLSSLTIITRVSMGISLPQVRRCWCQ